MHRLISNVSALCAFTFVISFAPSAFAQAVNQPDELQAIYACKSISSSQERLACYDNSVGRFEAAEKSGEVVTVSKGAIEKVERDAFGFNIPSLPSLSNIFGGKKETANKSKKENDITAPIKQADRSQIPKTPTQSPALSTTPKPSDISKVTLDIRKTTEFGHKKTRFFMANGQVWEQTDSKKVRVPKVRNEQENTASISKAAMGSFFLRVNGKGSAIRVKRVR